MAGTEFQKRNKKHKCMNKFSDFKDLIPQIWAQNFHVLFFLYVLF